jgi:hypothetical protein
LRPSLPLPQQPHPQPLKVLELAEINCPDCKKVFASRDEYADHRKYPCVSGGIISTTVDLTSMLPGYNPESKYFQSMEALKNNKFRCKVCNRYFNGLGGIGFHLSKAHGIRISDEDRVNYSRAKAQLHYDQYGRSKSHALKKEDTAKLLKQLNEEKEKPVVTVPPFVPIRKQPETQLLIKWCEKCKTIYDMDFDVKRCPECDELLRKDVRRKSIRMSVQEVKQ